MMRKLKLSTVLLALLLALTMVGCATKIETSKESPRDSIEFGEQKPGNLSGSDVFSDRKLITTTKITLETDTFDQTLQDLDTACKTFGGFIYTSSVEGKRRDEYTPRTAILTFRIPTDKLDQFKAEIRKTGNVISENISSEDITSDYIDVEGRLATARAHKERLMELMDTAANLADLIALQKEIANVEAQIEQLTTSLEKWNNLVDLSTVNLTVREVDELVIKPVTPKSFGQKIVDTFKGSIDFLVEVCKWGVLLFTALLPFLAIAAVVFFICFAIIKKAKKKKQSSQQQTGGK